MYRCVCMGGLLGASVHVWRLEDSLLDLVLSFHQVGPRDQTKVIRLVNKYLFPLSHLVSQLLTLLNEYLCLLNCYLNCYLKPY